MAASNLTFFFFFLIFASSILLLSSFRQASAALCNKDDKKALIAINAAFNDSAFWVDDPAGCCEWYNIECNSDGRVTNLEVYLHDFHATIPDAIGDLPFLDLLSFHHLPNLVGTIPPAIAKLKRLRFLFINWTNVTGTVPSFVFRLPLLEQLDLSFNNLSGPIPAPLGGQPNLLAIDLSRNKLTGSLPPALFLNAPTLFRNTSQLPYLRLSHNNLSGEVPPELGRFAFEVIDLSRNKFSGDPSLLFGRSKLSQQIDLSRNMFEFDLTKVEFPETASAIDLNHNKIYGSIPQQIANLTNLGLFNVSYNRLCGVIPGGGRLAEFDESNFVHNKCLCGSPLPSCK